MGRGSTVRFELRTNGFPNISAKDRRVKKKGDVGSGGIMPLGYDAATQFALV
jgi:hypothetical protein